MAFVLLVIDKSGRSGYPIISGQVIRAIQNSSNENCYSILV
jgi:hypothetical protein